MSRNNVYVHSTGGRNSTPTDRFVVVAGTPSAIYAGEPNTLTARGSNTAILVADGGPLFSGAGIAAIPYAGVAAIDSTETAGLRGYVDNYMPLPDVQFAALAKTSTTADTLIEVDDLVGKRQIFDVTTRVFTIDATGTDSGSNTLVLVGGDYKKAEIWFRFLVEATYLGGYASSTAF